ncbi:hypothetical protein [Burkholderia perseverans]|uniref:hypothetical protein n=1 Tax=Burkholderia perseverans TaxID=2615214 RepID=UPI001FF071F2|nr:hypothetical protein [Burkholderia perseverans]
MQFQWPVLAHLIISTFDFVARFGGDRNNSPHGVIEPFVPESYRFSKSFYDVIENQKQHVKSGISDHRRRAEKQGPAGPERESAGFSGRRARRTVFISSVIFGIYSLRAGFAWFLNSAVILRAARDLCGAVPGNRRRAGVKDCAGRGQAGRGRGGNRRADQEEAVEQSREGPAPPVMGPVPGSSGVAPDERAGARRPPPGTAGS